MYKQVKPIINPDVRNLCYRPYPGHPKGCPNYGRKTGCPPQTKYFGEVIDTYYPVFAIWNIFDLATHIERMKMSHPQWSERQLVCCLYWQRTARMQLDRKIMSFVSENPGAEDYQILLCPEATGLNVTATMTSIGEILEWPPTTKTYQVAIAGKKLEG